MKIIKTSIRYSLQLQCTKHYYFNVNWSIRINITNNQVNVICNSFCPNSISAEPSNILHLHF